LVGALILAATTQVSTCEKWFHEMAGSPLRWDSFFRPLPLRFFAWRVVDHARRLVRLAVARRRFVPRP